MSSGAFKRSECVQHGALGRIFGYKRMRDGSSEPGARPGEPKSNHAEESDEVIQMIK